MKTKPKTSKPPTRRFYLPCQTEWCRLPLTEMVLRMMDEPMFLLLWQDFTLANTALLERRLLNRYEAKQLCAFFMAVGARFGTGKLE